MCKDYVGRPDYQCEKEDCVNCSLLLVGCPKKKEEEKDEK